MATELSGSRNTEPRIPYELNVKNERKERGEEWGGGGGGLKA